jgi:hypothetical protein
MQKKIILLCHAAVVVLLVVFAWLWLRSPDMRRPFELDEMITVQYYTWTGIDADGEARTFRHIDEYYETPRPGPFHLLMGTYCAMGRWPEPNNHILNSLLINFSTAAGPRDEFTARLPALLGGLAFAGLAYVYCGPVLGWRFAAPLAFLWAWFVPYTIHYSQTARGYSWMVALLPLLLVCAAWLARRPASVGRGVACAAVAVVTLLNVVSMAVDWLLPVYAALLLVKPSEAAPRDDPEGESDAAAVRAWRMNLLVQVLAVGGVGFMFFMSHLPNVFSSARQYGLPFSSSEEFFAVLGGIIHGLFPTAGWKLFAAAGAVGLLLLLASPRHRFLAILVGLVFAVNFAHFLAARRFPFERTTAHFLFVVMLGAAYLVEAVVRSAASPAGRAALAAGAAALTALLVYPSFELRLEDEAVPKRQILAQAAVPAAGRQTYLPFGWGVDYLLSLYGPRELNCTPVAVAGSDLQVCLFPELDPRHGWNTVVNAGRDGAAVWNTRYFAVPQPPLPEAQPYTLVRIVGKTHEFTDRTPAPDKALVFWYPDLAQMGISAKPQFDHVNGFNVKYIPRHQRLQAKLDVYSILQCFILIAETPAEYDKVAGLVREGIRRFGGRAVVLIPDAPK